jgi:hypothetical protein
MITPHPAPRTPHPDGAPQLQLLAVERAPNSAISPVEPQPTSGTAAGPGPALRALQHAEAAARISAANVEECSQGGLLSGPQPDRWVDG